MKEINFQDNKGNYHQKYYVEEGNEKITHLIYVNEYSSIADYYDTPTIKFLKYKNKAEQRRTKFSVIDSCKEYLEKISDKFIEEKITKDKFDNKNDDYIRLKRENELKLKRVFIDEIGQTIINTYDQPCYSYYTTKNDLIIKVELPGKGANLKVKTEKIGEFYNFAFSGEKPCDQSEIEKSHKIKSDLKKKMNFHFNIYISVKEITLDLNENGKLSYYDKDVKDGIFIFKYYLEYGDTTDFE